MKGEVFYACGICGMIYERAEDARACESWCSAHGSCNTEITSRSVGSISRAEPRLRK